MRCKDEKFMKSTWSLRFLIHSIYHKNKIIFKDEISPKKSSYKEDNSRDLITIRNLALFESLIPTRAKKYTSQGHCDNEEPYKTRFSNRRAINIPL